jgi:hypothetical protein
MIRTGTAFIPYHSSHTPKRPFPSSHPCAVDALDIMFSDPRCSTGIGVADPNPSQVDVTCEGRRATDPIQVETRLQRTIREFIETLPIHP